VMGHLIPAGTGLKKYRIVSLKTEELAAAEVKEEEFKTEESSVE